MSLRYQKNPQTAGRIIDGEAFVVTPNDNRLHTLNQSATRVWSKAGESKTGISLDDATTILLETYDIDAKTAMQDAKELLDDLTKRHILLAD